MAGLYVLFVMAIWVGVLLIAVWPIGRRVRLPYGPVIAAIVFVGALPLPLVDEMIGKRQFQTLCERDAVYRKGVSNLEGRTARVTFDPSNELVSGTAIPIYHTHTRYTDVTTEEVILESDEYIAKGGILIRALGVSESNSPLLIGRPGCSPDQTPTGGVAAHTTFKFTVLN